jgi:hypothetical protein
MDVLVAHTAVCFEFPSVPFDMVLETVGVDREVVRMGWLRLVGSLKL